MTSDTDRRPAEERFREVFVHLGAVTAYARRRGSRDADGIAAEAMSIAWRRLADVPRDDPLPWLYATARNLLLAEWRRESRTSAAEASEPSVPGPELHELDPQLHRALCSLGPADREALLLVAWEDLEPTQAARVLGLKPTAFRVRLLRARRRLRAALDEERRPAPLAQIDVEGT
jgi:RNA polymerase sigma-70 factor (ECF subfamily)